jgi:hypothetical protein
VVDYDAKIRVSADTKQAESELSKLQKRISQLGDAAFKLDARNFQKSVRDIGTAVQGIGQRGALGALTLAAGKATTALGGLGAKFGVIGAAAASAGATVNSALGGVPSVITDILNHIGQVPNAFGIAAVAAMAFAPQILKASSAATGLAAAVDKAVGAQTTQKIAQAVDSIGQLNVELNATASTFQDLVSGSTLNQLNNQLRDAVKQSGEFHSSTVDAVVAAQQLVAVQKEQRKEQKAINDLIRQAQGLQPQDVRDAELNRRVALLKSREIQQQKDLKLQNQINVELAEYERLAAQVAAQTKLWASNLERIARSSKAGVFGTQSQLRTRVQEFQENRRSAEIARQRNAEIQALEARQRGTNYNLSQVPARGELFPGGNTMTASPQYRAMLNAQAQMRQAATNALVQSERTLLGFQAQTLKTEQQITAAKRQQQSIDERSIQVLRDQNKLLMEQYRAQQRVASGTLDPASLRADRQRRVEQGRAAQARRREMTENVIIGGAFPMLFGGGAGTVAGGALGGLIPGNPMLSVATSAVGALVDQFVASVTEAGSAMRDPITNFQKIADAGLIASRSQKQYIERLIEAGRVTEAAAAIQAEIVQKIGAKGVKDLQNAGAASDSFNKKLAELNLQIQAAVAGPLTDLLTWFNNFLSSVTAYNRQQAAQTDFLTSLRQADPQAYQQYFKESMQLRAANNGVVDPKALQSLQQQYTQRFNLQPGAVSSSIDKTPELQAQAQTKELAAQVQLEAQKLTLAGMSLEKDGQSYVAVAKRVAEQEYENKLLEIKNFWIGKAYDAEKNQLMIRQANLQLAAKNKDIDAQAARANEQANKDRIRALQQTLQLQIQLGQTTVDEYQIFEQSVQLYKGPIAGYEKSLILLEKRFAIQEGIINREYEAAQYSEEYATNQATIDAIYKNRLNNLKLELDFLTATLTIQKERAKLEQAVAIRQLISQNAQRRVAGQNEINKLRTQMEFPLGGEQLERDLLQLDQYARRMSEIIPLQEKINQLNEDITTAIATPGVMTETQLALKQRELAIEEDQLKYLQNELELRDKLEQQLLQQQQFFTTYGQLIQGVSSEISNLVTTSVVELIKGTKTAEQVFVEFLDAIGNALIQTAQQMITQYIALGIAKIFAFGSSGSGFSFSGAGPASGASVFGSGQAGFNPAAFTGGFGFRANGGPVSSQSPYIVGERGPELFVPGTGGSVVPTNDLRAAMGAAPGSRAGSPVLNMSFETTNIGGVEYVSRDQLEAAMATTRRQAASDGAKRGMSMTLDRIQQSPQTRNRLGLR